MDFLVCQCRCPSHIIPFLLRRCLPCRMRRIHRPRPWVRPCQRHPPPLRLREPPHTGHMSRAHTMHPCRRVLRSCLCRRIKSIYQQTRDTRAHVCLLTTRPPRCMAMNHYRTECRICHWMLVHIPCTPSGLPRPRKIDIVSGMTTMTSLACRPRDLIEAHLIILPVSAALGWVRRFNWCSLSLSFFLSFSFDDKLPIVLT